MQYAHRFSAKNIMRERNFRAIGGRTNTGIKPKYDEVMGRIGLH
jgi:hypothetical protein